MHLISSLSYTCSRADDTYDIFPGRKPRSLLCSCESGNTHVAFI